MFPEHSLVRRGSQIADTITQRILQEQACTIPEIHWLQRRGECSRGYDLIYAYRIVEQLRIIKLRFMQRSELCNSCPLERQNHNHHACGQEDQARQESIASKK